MCELHWRGLFEADDRGALRIEGAEHVVHSAVLATGIQGLQHDEHRVLSLRIQQSLLVGEFHAIVFGLLPRRFF